MGTVQWTDKGFLHRFISALWFQINNLQLHNIVGPSTKAHLCGYNYTMQDHKWNTSLRSSVNLKNFFKSKFLNISSQFTSSILLASSSAPSSGGISPSSKEPSILESLNDLLMLTISISFTLYITNLLSFVNSETQLDHTVNPLCVHSRLLKFSWKEKSWDTSISILNFPVTPVANLKRESRGEECSLKKQHHQILHRLVTLVGFHPLSQVLNCASVSVNRFKIHPWT